MPASMICRPLLDNGPISKTSVSESSVSRFVNQLMAENRMTDNKDMRRYERPHVNEVWCGGSSVGPRMITENGKKKVYIIALMMTQAVLSPALTFFSGQLCKSYVRQALCRLQIRQAKGIQL